jgi:hypothetical protein
VEKANNQRPEYAPMIRATEPSPVYQDPFYTGLSAKQGLIFKTYSVVQFIVTCTEYRVTLIAIQNVDPAACIGTIATATGIEISVRPTAGSDALEDRQAVPA